MYSIEKILPHLKDNNLDFAAISMCVRGFIFKSKKIKKKSVLHKKGHT